ncbi:capsule biosynthesis GfcC family protein, partial [Salmonella enterica subsp. enterica serovar Virginia]|nr:capsule biosynthesis GfcC family protein [Salmonella enterica subsp. enterica serovar Virginia]
QPTQVTLFGLISQPGSQPFVPGRDVASYLEGQRLLSGADRSYVADSIFRQMRNEPHPVPRFIVMSAGTGGTSATIGRYIRCQGY